MNNCDFNKLKGQFVDIKGNSNVSGQNFNTELNALIVNIMYNLELYKFFSKA